MIAPSRNLRGGGGLRSHSLGDVSDAQEPYVCLKEAPKQTLCSLLSSDMQSNCTDWKFCAETCIKNDIKTCETRQTCSNYEQYMKFVPVFPVLRSLVQNLRRLSNILRNHVIA